MKAGWERGLLQGEKIRVGLDAVFLEQGNGRDVTGGKVNQRINAGFVPVAGVKLGRITLNDVFDLGVDALHSDPPFTCARTARAISEIA